MKTKAALFMVAAIVATALLGGCATDPQVSTMKGSGGDQQVTVPGSTWTGAASGEQASALAKIVVDANNNSMKEFEKIDGHLKSQDQRMAKIEDKQDKSLQAAEQALAKLEKMSNEQGTGQLTLFFKTGSSKLDHDQTERLVRFLDYISIKSKGRKAILLSIGSASAIGSAKNNMKLSKDRSEAPIPVIDKYLVNVPHTFFKVTGIGDMYAPKGESMQVEQRYQNVRLIAVYDTASIPETPGSK